MAGYYQGNEPGQTVGVLDSPYSWWEAGALFDALVQYWRLTGDDQYNGIVSQGILAQQGPNSDFMPTNQSTTEGNDDQGIWALAAMSAAESQLPGAPVTTWFDLADFVYNDYVARWDTSTCGGGLRWQIFSYNAGYLYKNAASNGAFFQLASRLARYTGNSTYSDWASTAYDWSTSIGLIDDNWNVYDGASTTGNCTDLTKIQFSYTAGLYISGAAHMYNITTGAAQTKWQGELTGLLNQTLSVFLPNGVATEVSCEYLGTCTIDMQAYKGLLGRWLIDTIEVAPYTSSSITPKLASSAEAAAEVCTEGLNGSGCPFTWTGTAGNASAAGLGGELDALSFVQGLLVNQVATPAATTAAGSNGTATTGSDANSTESGASSTASGEASPIPSKSAGDAIRAERVSMGIVAGLFSLIAWLIL